MLRDICSTNALRRDDRTYRLLPHAWWPRGQSFCSPQFHNEGDRPRRLTQGAIVSRARGVSEETPKGGIHLIELVIEGQIGKHRNAPLAVQ
jgi:hypothetical protein